MEELIIYKYQANTIENALRMAMNALGSRNKTTETAMDRELLLAEKHIKEVLNKNSQIVNGELVDFCEKCEEFKECWENEEYQKNCKKYEK